MKSKLLYLLAIIGLIGCIGPEADMWERVYRVNNNTNFDVVLRFYENFSEEVFEDINLSENQSYSGTEISGSNFDALNDTESIRPGQSFSSFNIIIIFNSEKKIEYSLIDTDDDGITDSFSEPLDRNLLRDGNYSNIGNNIYQFELTQEDYDIATPCNGDCLD
jgi:hypothetical protein